MMVVLCACSKHLQCIYVNRDFKKGDVTVLSSPKPFVTVA